MHIVGWRHVGLCTVNIAIDHMVFIHKAGEMRILAFKLLDDLDLVWEFGGQFSCGVWDMFALLCSINRNLESPRHHDFDPDQPNAK